MNFKSYLIGLATAVIVFAAGPATAIERVNTKSKTCASIQNTLINNGAAILRYSLPRKPGLTLYDRYVGDSRYCASNEIGKWASLPTKDTNNCRVIACERFNLDEFFPFKQRHRAYFRIQISN